MNESIWLVLGLGFILGIKHATEADHLVCVATIVSEQRSVRRSAMIGALWGVGHTCSLLVAGVLVILLQFTIPARVAVQLELAVALMVVLLGSRALYLSLRRQRFVHVHTHTHGGRAHTHLHFHEPHDAHVIADPHAQERAGHRLTGWRILFVGVVHGLAGSAALTLLVLTEVARSGSDLLGLAYLLLFGVGSIGGMLLMSTAISLPFVFTANRLGGVNVPIRMAAGIASVAFGIYYAWSIALGNRL